MTTEKLVALSKDAMLRSYSPYSGYKVGAALLCKDGTVYQAQIDKSHIYAYFDGRNESEVIVDPKYLMDITDTESMDNSFDITM